MIKPQELVAEDETIVTKDFVSSHFENYVPKKLVFELIKYVHGHIPKKIRTTEEAAHAFSELDWAIINAIQVIKTYGRRNEENQDNKR